MLPLATNMDHSVSYASKQGNPANFYPASELAQMNPLRLSIDMATRSEYRAQQVE